VIHETIINVYGTVVRQVQELIKQFIVPAILDHDEMERGRSRGAIMLTDICSKFDNYIRLSGKSFRTMSLDISPEENKTNAEPSSLVHQLESYYKQCTYFGLEDCYIEQIFKQLMYYICAVSLNSLMLRQDMCTWKTGMKIRYNVSCLEDWIRRKKLVKANISPYKDKFYIYVFQSNDVHMALLPLTQVSSLLQSRKSEEDVQSICDMSYSLAAATVLKVSSKYWVFSI
jgi:myosin V